MKYSDVMRAKMMSKEFGEIAESAYQGEGLIGAAEIVVRLYVGLALAALLVVLFIAEKVKQYRAKKKEQKAEQAEEIVQESTSKEPDYTV